MTGDLWAATARYEKATLFLNPGFLVVVVSVLGQGKLWQAIQLDSSTVIAFRKRAETVPASTAPPRSPIPGFIRIPGDTKRYLYDVVLAENGVETVLETLEILRFRT